MTIRAVGSSAFSCATTIVTAPLPSGLYVAWKIPIEGVYDAAASAATASASAPAHATTVRRIDFFITPSLWLPASPACRREPGLRVVPRNENSRLESDDG